MAVYKLFPEKDASIYSAYNYMNTGLDAILDVKNEVTESNPVSRVARTLIKFNQSEIDNALTTISNVTESNWNNWSVSLRCYVAKATNITLDSTLYAYPISGSWNNGTGQYLDNIINGTGASWKYSAYSGSTEWPTSAFGTLVTASWSGSDNAGGAVWFTGSNVVGGEYEGITNITSSQTFTLRSDKDLNMDVTNAIKVWHSGSTGNNTGRTDIQNQGFILKWSDDIEFTTSSAVTPQLSYYSVDTNTIYPPQLEIKWRDFSYSTSSGEFFEGRTLTGSYPTNEITSSISCSYTQSLPAPDSNTGIGTGATFGATFKSSSMLNVFVKEIGSGYKAGDVLTWNAATLNNLSAVSGATTDAVVTLSTFDIQQLNVIDTPDLFMSLDNNQGVFYSESINNFRLNVRPEFPVRTFETSSIDTLNYALPSASYYAIKDLDTNEFVVDFDRAFTQISCDPTGSFFKVYMNGLEPERYYQILIQTTVQGNTIVMDENYYFKVING